MVDAICAASPCQIEAVLPRSAGRPSRFNISEHRHVDYGYTGVVVAPLLR
jgi:hypothetical protein